MIATEPGADRHRDADDDDEKEEEINILKFNNNPRKESVRKTV